MVLRTYTVFNLDQVEGLDHLRPKLDPVEPFQALDEAERILRDSGAKIFHTALDKALFNPREDHIVLPFKENFKSPEAYYGVALHELTQNAESRIMPNQFRFPCFLARKDDFVRHKTQKLRAA